MPNPLESIARGEVAPGDARSHIATYLKDGSDVGPVYSALVRWTWTAMAERRLDHELRQWHRLFLDVSALVSRLKTADAGGGLPARQAAERIKALSDLIRVSISMAKNPDIDKLASRAHVIDLLEVLAERPDEAVSRTELQERLGLKTANLSRILGLLVVNGLVDREARGRAAGFRITGIGKHVCDQAAALAAKSAAKVKVQRERVAIPRPERAVAATDELSGPSAVRLLHGRSLRPAVSKSKAADLGATMHEVLEALSQNRVRPLRQKKPGQVIVFCAKTGGQQGGDGDDYDTYWGSRQGDEDEYQMSGRYRYGDQKLMGQAAGRG